MDRRQGFAFSQSSPDLRQQQDDADNSAEAPRNAASMHPPRTHSQGAIASHFPAQPADAYGGQSFAFSHSSPNLGQQLGNADNSTEAPRNAASMHPPRTHSHGAVASHSLAQPPDAYGGQTWMDFLREPGAAPDFRAQQHMAPPPPRSNLYRQLPPLPPNSGHNPTTPRYSLPARPLSTTPSRSSSDRKRRLTTADSPLRRPSDIRMHSGNAAGSSGNPILLDSPPAATSSQRPPLPPSFPSQASMGRRDSEFALPRWQPDSEVTHCFVCGSQFTFFYRKHHCRKCGRVVCSACSPHRITIPRQYIVHSPHDTNMIDLTSDDDNQLMARFGPFGNPALGGGEEVRVCNPCVPDPNYNPPPQHGQTRSFPPFTPPPHSPHLPGPNVLQRIPPRAHRSTQSVNDRARTVSHGQAPRSRDPFTDRRTSYHGSSRVSDLWPPTQPPSYGFGQPPGYDFHAGAPSRQTLGSSSTHPQLDPDNFDGSNMASRRGFFSRGPPSRPPSPQPPPAPRRQIAEEDECPVCGEELPAKGLDGDDSARTQHVAECISLHSGGSPPPAPPGLAGQTSTSLPSHRTRGMSGATGNGEGSSNRMSVTMRGLVPYVATEKDCVDEEGKEAECVICFEEFEAGDKMARLVCWCKFHEACIRQWWDKKGRGDCPTHQFQY